MKKKVLLLFASMLMSIWMAHADDSEFTGIIVTTDGGTVAYAMTDMPTLTRSYNGATKVLNITVKGQETPVASLELSDDKPLEVGLATYTPTAIKGVTSDKVTVTEKNGKKFITGGRLVIIDKDGKMYDAAGKETK